MSGYPALDVALGLILVYIVLALVCSTVNETIATAVGLRARFLQLALLNLLSAAGHHTEPGIATAKRFYAHPLVQAMIRPAHGPDPSLDPTAVAKWWRKPPYPSYLPAQTFVAAVMDIARESEAAVAKADDPPEAAAAQARIKDMAAGLERTLTAIPNKPLSDAMLALYRTVGNDATHFQQAVARWFDDSMERVSGWYKRRVHVILAVIASLVVVFLNADTITIGSVLWRDDAARAAVVSQAEAVAKQSLSDVKVDRVVSQLDLPLGWNLSFGDQATQLPDDVTSWLAKIVGLGLTIGAVMMGAPFWFDLLSKVARLRGTGAPPPATDAVRFGEGEEERAGPGATVVAGGG